MITDFIPQTLQVQIANYLRRQCDQSMNKSWRRNRFDEDSVTAAFFENLSTEEEILKINGEDWQWSIEYTTTSSKGPNPLEPIIGADVIFFIDVLLPNGSAYKKGILVQSKIESNIERKELESQIGAMENYIENGSVVLTYDKKGFKCTVGKNYLLKRGQRWSKYSDSFCSFLADTFLECKYGVENLYYDFERNEVQFDNYKNGKVRFVPQRGASRIKIRKI